MRLARAIEQDPFTVTRSRMLDRLKGPCVRTISVWQNLALLEATKALRGGLQDGPTLRRFIP